MGCQVYEPNEAGTFYAEVLNSDGTPANAAVVTLTVWRTDGTMFLNAVNMPHIAGSNGMYEYDFNAPAVECSMVADVSSVGPTAYGTDEICVTAFAKDITGIETATTAILVDTGNILIDTANILLDTNSLVAAFISYVGVTTANGALDGSTLIDAGLAAVADLDGNQVVITGGAFAGQARDINGTTALGTVTPHLVFGGQIPIGTGFTIVAIRTVPAEVAEVLARIGTNIDAAGTGTLFAHFAAIEGAGFATANHSLVRIAFLANPRAHFEV